MSKTAYPTLGCSVPVYNYLIDKIEDFLDEKQRLNVIVTAANKAKDKIQKYYPTSDGLVYVIATSMCYFDFYLIIILNYLNYLNYLNSYGSKT
jgi:hypothetical protein